MSLFIHKEGVVASLRTLVIDKPLEELFNHRFQHTDFPNMTVEETREFENLMAKALYPDMPAMHEIYAKDIRTSPLLPFFHTKEWTINVKVPGVKFNVKINTTVCDKWTMDHPRYKHTPIVVTQPIGEDLRYNFYTSSPTIVVAPSNHMELYNFLTAPYAEEIKRCLVMTEEMHSFFNADEQNYFHNVSPKTVYNTYRSLYTYIPLFRAIYLDSYHGKDPVLKHKPSNAEVIVPPVLTAFLTAKLLQRT